VLAHTVSDFDVDEEFVRAAQAAGVVNTSSAGVFTGHARLLQEGLELSAAEARCGDPEVVEAWQQWVAMPMGDRPFTPDWLTEAKQLEQQMVENIRVLHAAGVRVAVGSDGGNIGSMHGASFHKELRLLSEAGLTPAEVIVAATRNGAQALGRDRDLGTLEVGKFGDLAVLDANPLADVANLARVIGVVVKGTYLTPDQFDADGRE
jgi:imidazolonepropionase-like amidohydrolase